jgi:hypothetical protein
MLAGRRIVATIAEQPYGRCAIMATEERVLCFERKPFEELGVFQV